ncbi:MAG TPA: metal ABC transporter permease [Candidatus Acidoferrum sp.]|nr:metal ABC transporter permease [Candidatus Acidoferrum sp.]
MTADLPAVALSVAMAIAAGLVGCFAVMRRMTLASDAISHVALPGIAIALLLHVQPFVGGLVALLLGTLLIWVVESRTRMATETVIGVVFSGALAVGAMFTRGEELIEALFGGAGALPGWELALGLVGAAGVVVFVLGARHQLVLALVSPDLARSAGVRVERLSLLYLLAFSFTVALGLRYLGVLLMGSLIIIPAATAKHATRSLGSMLAVAVAVAVSSTLVGTALARALQRETGPVIITVAAGVFFLALLRRRPR